MKNIILVVLVLSIVLSLIAQNVFEEAIAIRQGTNIEWFRSSTAIADGVVYVWSDTRNGGRDLFAQLITSTGEKAWGPEGLTVDNSFERQEDPMTITASDGNVIIAYVDFSVDADGDIRANKITPQGTKLWGDNGISICSFPGEQISINLVPDNDGGTYIAWQDKRTASVQTYVQHVNESGTVTWATGGINIYPVEANTGSNTFWEDEIGGGVMAMVVSDRIYALRIDKDSPNGIDWGPTLIAGTDIDKQGNPKMCPDGDGGFIFAWEYLDPIIDNKSRLKLQRINIDGDLLWGPNGKNLTDIVEVKQEKHRIVEVESGGAIIAWENNREADRPLIYVQKIDLLGDSEWTEGGIPLYSAPNIWQKNLRMTKTSDDGAVIVWEDTRNIAETQEQIFAQKINSDGTKAWNPDGVIFSNTPGGQEGANVKQLGDDFAIVWIDKRTGSDALMTQMVSSAGNFVFSDEIQIYYGLSGQAAKASDQIEFVMKTFGDKTYIVWNDSRHGSIFMSKMYYQIIDADGNALMPTNGARVSIPQGEDNIKETRLVAEINDAGELCIVWVYTLQGQEVFYAQIINANGQRMLGDTGLQLRENGRGAPANALVTWRNNGWEIFWAENVFTRDIYAQRIENYELAWGNSARFVMTGYDDLTMMGDNLIPYAITGDYLLFGKGVEATRLIKLNPNATPIASWGQFGALIQNGDLESAKVQLFETEDKILAFWIQTHTFTDSTGTHTFPNTIHAAILNLDGTPAYDERVLLLTDLDNEQINLTVHQDGDIFTLTYLENYFVGGIGNYITKSKKVAVTNNGINNLWGNDGVHVSSSVTNTHILPTSIAFDDFNLVSWSMKGQKDFDIFMGLVRADGTVPNTISPGLLINDHDKDQDYPIIARHGNSSIVTIAWIDGLSSGKDPIFGIYMQRVDLDQINSSSDKPKEDVISIISGTKNYPNPFNPETTISFDLKQPALTTVEIFNIKGQKVNTLLKEHLESGRNTITWNGQNQNGKPVGSGIYFYRISTDHHAVTQKMILLK